MARVISLTRPLPASNGIAHTEWAARAVDGLGLDPPAMLHVAITIAGYVQAAAVNLETEVEASRTPASPATNGCNRRVRC
jgi:hypothetical protein